MFLNMRFPMDPFVFHIGCPRRFECRDDPRFFLRPAHCAREVLRDDTDVVLESSAANVHRVGGHFNEDHAHWMDKGYSAVSRV